MNFLQKAREVFITLKMELSLFDDRNNLIWKTYEGKEKVDRVQSSNVILAIML